jgi:hypothetical protein
MTSSSRVAASLLTRRLCPGIERACAPKGRHGSVSSPIS